MALTVNQGNLAFQGLKVRLERKAHLGRLDLLGWTELTARKGLGVFKE